MAELQDNNTKLDGSGSVTQEQRVKVQEKLDRCRKEKDTIKVKYTEALQELNRANPKYMDDMNEVFTRCQTFEKDRLAKFREFLGSTEKCLQLSNRIQSPIFQQFAQTIKNCDADRDLSWWSDTYGATMKMNWPIFEEYSESHRTITRRVKGDNENPVVVTAIRSNNNGSLNTAQSLDNRSATNPNYGETTSNGGHSSYPASANPFLDDDDNVDSLPTSHQPSYQSPKSKDSPSHDSSAGVPVRALYDYVAQEQDELSFKQGEIFTKLEDEDDQGWCKGRVAGRIGLYPATYVEVL